MNIFGNVNNLFVFSFGIFMDFCLIGYKWFENGILNVIVVGDVVVNLWLGDGIGLLCCGGVNVLVMDGGCGGGGWSGFLLCSWGKFLLIIFFNMCMIGWLRIRVWICGSFLWIVVVVVLDMWVGGLFGWFMRGIFWVRSLNMFFK